MSELFSAENALTNLKHQVSVLDIVAKPCLNATKQIAVLNTSVLKELASESTEATLALGSADWEPWARLAKGLATFNSPRATQYTVALGQILGAANTQIFVNASWAGLGAHTDTMAAATALLPSFDGQPAVQTQPAAPGQASPH